MPTDVPIDYEMKQAATKSPGTIYSDGKILIVNLTVASIAPISFANDANAPARMNIHIIYRIFGYPAERENVSILSANEPPFRYMTTLHIDAVSNATETGIL